MLNSLKGKIWITAAALAFFICTFGLLSYLMVSFVVNDTFYSIFVPFLFVAAVVMLFGWWLANEVTRPIEKVSLMAKSLERNPSATLPKTSGSVETDELLQTVFRSSQQIQKLIALMDEVAAGNTQVALAPLNAGDRLTTAFQRLLSRISESIDAKKDLEELQAGLQQLVGETAGIRNGRIDAEISTDFAETKEIAEAFVFLLNYLSALAAQVKTDAGPTSAVDARKTVQSAIQQEEAVIQEMNQASLALSQVPANLEKITESLSGAVSSANQALERAQRGSLVARESLNAVNMFRKQLQEAVRRVGRLNERSQEIAHIAKTVEELVHRTNMIALNASIQADKLSEKGNGFAVVANEMERLAARAGNTNKQMSSLNESLAVEISEAERSLKVTVNEAVGLSKFAMETGSVLNELEKHVLRVINLQDQMTANSSEQTGEAQKAFQVFVNSTEMARRSVAELRYLEKSLLRITQSFDGLNAAVADLRTVGDSGSQLPPVSAQAAETNEVQARVWDAAGTSSEQPAQVAEPV